MLDNVTRTTLILILLFGLFALNVQPTSADLTAQRTVRGNKLRATTISLENQHTATLTILSSLFNTIGFQPNGYDVRTVKIVKTGELDFKYRIKAEPVAENSQECNNYVLSADKDWTSTYNGTLMDFVATSEITETKKDDWLFFLFFNAEDETSQNTTCSFRIVVNTYRNNPDDPLKGLWAKKILDNTVTTGTW